MCCDPFGINALGAAYRWWRCTYHRLMAVIPSGSMRRFRVAGFARIRFMTDVDVLRSLRDQCSRCCVPVVALRLPPANGCDPFGIDALDNP